VLLRPLDLPTPVAYPRFARSPPILSLEFMISVTIVETQYQWESENVI